MKERKPKYGWYVKKLIVGFSIVGLLGLSLTIFGFYFEDWMELLLIISGITLMILFLWPGLGMGIMNINLSNKSLSRKETKLSYVIKSPKILDVGCGTGRHAIQIAKTLKNGGHLYGIDIYSKVAIGGNALDTVQRNAHLEGVDNKTTFQYGSAIDIPFDNEMFDIVYFSSVLHELHMEGGPDKALDEAYRILKPGGYLKIAEWNRSSWQTIVYCGIFCLVFKKYQYWSNLIKKHGFRIEKQRKINGMHRFSAIKPKI
ncbi:MAG: methyltransferase domain-containing protein [Candidatus Odinarchaeota archaeon]